MAAFCTNCGTALRSTTGFCASCGAPIVAEPVAAPVQAAPVMAPVQAMPVAAPVQAAPPPVAYYPAMQPAKSPSALKIVLIVIATVIGLGVLGFGALVFIGWRAAKSINVTNNGNGVTAPAPATSPATTGTAPALTAQDLGVPLYPGATLDPSGSSTIANGTTKVVQATYWTTDPVSSVTSFYQSKLGSGLNVMGLGGETIMNYGSGGNTVTMMVDSENGKTKMNVIHTFTPGQ